LCGETAKVTASGQGTKVRNGVNSMDGGAISPFEKGRVPRGRSSPGVVKRVVRKKEVNWVKLSNTRAQICRA